MRKILINDEKLLISVVKKIGKFTNWFEHVE